MNEDFEKCEIQDMPILPQCYNLTDDTTKAEISVVTFELRKWLLENTPTGSSCKVYIDKICIFSPDNDVELIFTF